LEVDIDVFAPADLPTVLRVLRTALNADGPLDQAERAFLNTYARIAGTIPGAAPLPIAAADVEISGSHPRKRLIQLSAMAVLLGRPVRPASVQFLKDLGRRLATHDSVIDVVDALHRGKHLKVKLLARRRAFRVMIKEALTAEGPMGVMRFFAAILLKAPVNRDKLWNYRRLGLLAEGTLGREYWKHMTEIGFGFPGDIAGIADTVAYHDVSHVLTGNDTTPLGEIQQGSFQGGNRREDGFLFIQFVILHFHQGVQITPAAPPAIGNFDPAKVLWAVHRGAKCNVDMTHQWDFWPLMALPLEEARRRCALLPALGVAVAS
jgi:hypothetical protein